METLEERVENISFDVRANGQSMLRPRRRFCAILRVLHAHCSEHQRQPEIFAMCNDSDAKTRAAFKSLKLNGGV